MAKAKKSAAPTITIRGKVITAQQIAAFGKSLAAQSDVITTWANYCAIQACVYDSTNAVNNMLQNAAFRLSTGKLSKLGKEVESYIRAHAPQIKLDDKTVRYVVKRYSAEKAHERRFFVNPANLDESGKARFSGSDVGGEFAPCHDFALTFDQWRTLEKAEKEPKPVTLKAATVANQLTKALEAINSKAFSATADEARELAKQLSDLFVTVDFVASQLAAKAEKVDTEKAAELLKSGQSGKSKRAGGKVEKAV